MPRQPRLDLPGQYYHVIVRGVDRRAIFRADVDRTDFLNRLSQGLHETGTLCLTWALVTNHLHLLLLSGARGLAALMQPLLTGYVGAFNRRYRRIGHLVQNRFKSILCEEDPYLLELLRYIPLNPVRAGIVKTLEELARYPWTGHGALLGTATHPWQATEEALSHFGSTMSRARKHYVSYISDGWSQGHRDDLEGGGLFRSLGGINEVLKAKAAKNPQAFDAQILGSGAFVENILRQADHLDDRREMLRGADVTLKTVQNKVAEMLGVEPEAILRRDRRQPVADARALFVYAAVEYLGQRLTDLSRMTGLLSGSLSQARQRGRRLIEKYPLLQKLTRPAS